MSEQSGEQKKRGVGMRIALTVVVVIVVVIAFAVLKPPAGPSASEKVLVLCGGSMRAALEDIIARYQTKSEDVVEGSFGGSGELCAQIQSSGRGDVYVCHDPFMEWAEKQGLIDAWTQVGQLNVVTIVPKGNPKNIQTLEDLAQPGLRVGIGDQQHSTSGVTVNHILKSLPYGEDIRKNIRSETKGHQARCQDVVDGHLDAGIAWSAVAKLFEDKLDVIPIPKEYIDTFSSATYGVSDLRNIKVTMGLTKTGGSNEKARAFYEFATKECGDIWEKYGFAPWK